METELRAMVNRLSESVTSFRGWRQYYEDKAEKLASSDPQEFSQLPMILAAHVKRLRDQYKGER